MQGGGEEGEGGCKPRGEEGEGTCRGQRGGRGGQGNSILFSALSTFSPLPSSWCPPPLPPLQTSPLLAYVPTCYPELVLDIVAAYRASEHPFASPREVGVCLGEGWLCINLLPYSTAVYFPLLLPSLLPCLTHGP